jgi:glutamate carboxypeptidase
MNAVASGVLEQIIATSLERLRELCAISSESGNAAGLRRVAARLGADLERFGLTVEVVEDDDANGSSQPTLIARGPAVGERHLLLIGHMDTVLPAVAPEVDGRRIFATGALDMKGGLAMLTGALELLAARGQKPPSDFLFVAVPDEEAEGAISTRAMNRWSRNARTVLVLEPGKSRGKGETLVAGRRGLTEWALEVRGTGAHSGLAFWSGRSAVAAASDFCARAHKLSRPGAGPTVNIGRLVGGSADFVDDLGRNHGMVGTSRQLNVVSDLARAEGEFRFLTTAEGEGMNADLASLAAEIAAEYGVTIEYRPGATIAPVDPHGPGAALVQRAVELAAARGFHLEVEEDRGGVSFPNFLAEPGKVPVVDGLGPTGDGMHVRGEYLNLDSFEQRIVLLADLLATL